MNNGFSFQLAGFLNKQLTKKNIRGDLKTLDNSMYIRVIAKLSKTITRKALDKQLKELSNLSVKVGANIKTDGKARTQIEKNIKVLEKNLSNLEIGLQSSKGSKINSDIETIRKTAQRKASANPISFNLELKKQKLVHDIEYLGKRYSKIFNNVSASKKYERILDSAYSISDEGQLKTTRAQLQAFTAEIKANGLAAQSTGDKFKSLISRWKEFFSAAALIRTVFLQVREAVNVAVDLDKAYTDLIKVQDSLTRNDYPDYLAKCNKKAKELAMTQKGLMEGATEFSKSGYDLQTSDALTEKSTLLANVGDMSASDSAKAIISGVQAYDTVDGYTDAVSKAEALIDKYNEIGNTASITTAEIAQGVQSVGSVFADANTSVDEFISLLAAGNRQFQDADSLALGLRTSALRIRGCTAELEAMGEETDGVYKSASNLEKKIAGLTNIDGKGGVKILEADGETFRSMYDVFVDIGKVYKDMADTDQSALLELIAGKHRASAVSATLNNIAEAENILQNSLNATGSAQKEYDKYLESTEAHLAKFQATLTETYTSFINGGAISGLTDMGTALLELVNKTDLLKHGFLALIAIGIGKTMTTLGGGIASVTKQMNTLGTALQKVKDMSSLESGSRSDALRQLGEETASLTEKNLKLLLSQKQLTESDRIKILQGQNLTEQQAKEKLEKMGLTAATTAQTAANTAETASTFTLAGAMSSLKASVVGVGTAIKAAFLSNPIGWVLTGATTAISLLTSAISSHNQEVKEAREQTLETAKSLKDEESNLVSLIEQYNKLDKTDRSTENTEEIKKLNDQINEALGTQAENIDLVNGKLDEQSDKLRRNLLQKLQDDKPKLDTAVSVAKSDYEEGIDAGTMGIDPWGKIKRVLTKHGATRLDGSDIATLDNDIGMLAPDERLQQLQAWIDLLTKADGQTGKYGDELASLQSWYDELEKKQKTYNEALESQQKNDAQQKILNDSLSGKVNDVTAFENYRNEIKEAYNDNSVLQNQMLDFVDTVFPDYAKGLTEVTDKVTDLNNKNDKTTISTFDKAWESIGTTGTDEEKKSAKEAKEQLLELAKTGKLTQEAFEKSPIATTLKDVGISAEEATKKVNELVSSTEQLSSMKSGISSISSILGEKKNNLSDKKTKTVGIGADTLAGMPEEVKANTAEYEHFIEILGNGNSTMEQCKKAANDLATAYVNSNNFLSNLTDSNKEYYISQLDEMGIQNSRKVVQDALNMSKVNEIMLNWDAVTATNADIVSKASEIKALAGASKAIKMYAFQKALANKNSLSTSKSVANLIALAEQCGITGNALKELETLQDLMSERTKLASDTKMNSHVRDAMLANLSARITAQQLKVEEAASKKVKVKTGDIDVKPDTSSSGKDSSKSSKSNTKQEIDWIARSIDRTTAKVDLLSAKLQNLFSVKAKNNNLDKQIKQTTKLINSYDKAVTKYTKKANSVKLSSSLKKLVRNGKVTGNYKKLVKEYGEKTASKIQKYQDYYDKAQEAKRNKAAQKTAKRELKQQKYQNYVDLYDTRASRAEVRSGNAVGFAEQNKHLETQIKNLKLSYDYQKKIAGLAKNKAEQDRLDAELKAKIAEIEKQQIDNIAKDYENRISLKDNAQQNIQNQVALLEAKGQIVTAGYYTSQNSYETQRRSLATAEMNAIQKKLTEAVNEGRIAKGSNEWYEIQSQLQGLRNTINECDINIVENTKKLVELHDAMVESITSNNSTMATEAEFLAALMGDNRTDKDTGTLTREGWGILGAYGIGMEASKASAKTYEEEVERIQKLRDANTKGEFTSIDERDKAYEEYYQKWRDSIKGVYDYESKIIDLITEKYQAQLSYMKEIIDAKKKALQAEKDLYDYQRNIANQTKNIATLQKQLAALRGDTSEEGRAKMSKLQLSLDEAQQELQDTEYDKYISDQESMLDNLYTEYEDLMNNLMKDQNKLLKDGIQAINDNSSSIKSVIDSYAEGYGYNYSDNFDAIMATMTGDNNSVVSSIKDALNGKDESSIAKVLESQADKICAKYDEVVNPDTNTNDAQKKARAEAIANSKSAKDYGSNATENGYISNTGNPVANSQTYNAVTNSDVYTYNKKLNDALNSMIGMGFDYLWSFKDGTPASYVNQAIQSNKIYPYKDKNKKQKYAYLNEQGLKVLAEKLKVNYPAKTGKKTAELEAYFKKAGFKHGGIGQLIKPMGEDGLAFVRNKEGFVAPEHVEQIRQLLDVVPDMTTITQGLYNLPKPQSGKHTINVGGVSLRFDKIEFPNVQNINDFIGQLKTDRRVQETVENCILDSIGSSNITDKIKL